MRDIGLQAEVEAKATPNELMGDTVFCTSLAGEELARLHTWGTHPRRFADYRARQPDAAQRHAAGPPRADPRRHRGGTRQPDPLRHRIPLARAGRRRRHGDGPRPRHRRASTRSARSTSSAPTAGARRSPQDIGLPMEGQMDVAGSMNIIFHADLSKYVAHRPSVLYWVLQPGANVGGIGLGLVRMVRPWDEWLIVWGYDINEPPPEVDEAFATKVAHELIGDDTIPITLRSTSLWSNNKAWAARYAEGRVFCMGDACHRHPPSNGLGSNTSIQDAYNLAWKLALVLQGKAAPSLLRLLRRRARADRQADRHAREPEHRGVRADLRGARRARDPRPRADAPQHRRAQGRHAARPPSSGRSSATAIELKNYEFNAHGVELGHRYRSGAVVPDGTPEPRLRARSRALLPPDDLARRAPAARVGRAPGREDRDPRRRGEGRARLDPRPRGQGPVHAVHRHRRRRLDRGGGPRERARPASRSPPT